MSAISPITITRRGRWHVRRSAWAGIAHVSAWRLHRNLRVTGHRHYRHVRIWPIRSIGRWVESRIERLRQWKLDRGVRLSLHHRGHWLVQENRRVGCDTGLARRNRAVHKCLRINHLRIWSHLPRLARLRRHEWLGRHWLHGSLPWHTLLHHGTRIACPRLPGCLRLRLRLKRWSLGISDVPI